MPDTTHDLCADANALAHGHIVKERSERADGPRELIADDEDKSDPAVKWLAENDHSNNVDAHGEVNAGGDAMSSGRRSFRDVDTLSASGTYDRNERAAYTSETAISNDHQDHSLNEGERAVYANQIDGAAFVESANFFRSLAADCDPGARAEHGLQRLRDGTVRGETERDVLCLWIQTDLREAGMTASEAVREIARTTGASVSTVNAHIRAGGSKLKGAFTEALERMRMAKLNECRERARVERHNKMLPPVTYDRRPWSNLERLTRGTRFDYSACRAAICELPTEEQHVIAVALHRVNSEEILKSAAAANSNLRKLGNEELQALSILGRNDSQTWSWLGTMKSEACRRLIAIWLTEKYVDAKPTPEDRAALAAFAKKAVRDPDVRRLLHPLALSPRAARKTAAKKVA